MRLWVTGELDRWLKALRAPGLLLWVLACAAGSGLEGCTGPGLEPPGGDRSNDTGGSGADAGPPEAGNGSGGLGGVDATGGSGGSGGGGGGAGGMGGTGGAMATGGSGGEDDLDGGTDAAMDDDAGELSP